MAPLALAVGAPGQLWLTASGPPDQIPVVGHLLRIDANDGQVTLDQTIGGDPESVAYSGTSVWVANGTGDGKTPTADANTVAKLDATNGNEMQRYQIDRPYGVAANTDTAWIAAQQADDKTTIATVQTSTGAINETATLPGSNAAGRPVIVAGGDAALIVTRDSNNTATIYRLNGNARILAQETLPASGNAALAYFGGALFAAVSNVQAGGIYRMDADNLSSTTISQNGALALAAANSHVWALSLDGASVQEYDATAAQPTNALVMLPGRGTLLAADNQHVWVNVELSAGNELVLIAPS